MKKISVTSLDKQTFINSELWDLDIKTSITNPLRAANINTIRDLLNYSSEDLLKIRKFGPTLVSKLKEILKIHGLSLKGDVVTIKH